MKRLSRCTRRGMPWLHFCYKCAPNCFVPGSVPVLESTRPERQMMQTIVTVLWKKTHDDLLKIVSNALSEIRMSYVTVYACILKSFSPLVFSVHHHPCSFMVFCYWLLSQLSAVWHANEAKGSIICSVLTLSPRLYVFLNTEMFESRLNSNNSYLFGDFYLS